MPRPMILKFGVLLLVALPRLSIHAEERVDTPDFSVPHGLYDTPQTITMASTTPGATIRYTTNSDWPTPTHGTIATGTVTITTTSVLRAIAYKTGMLPSRTRTQTYIFLGDVIRQRANANGTPDSPSYGWATTAVDQDIVNANLAEIHDQLRALPILAVASNNAHFFDATQGILAYGVPYPGPDADPLGN